MLFLFKMRGKRSRQIKTKFRVPPNNMGCFIALVGMAAGIVMIICGSVLGDECKMETIDLMNMDDPNIKGQIPFWNIYAGSVYLVCGFILAIISMLLYVTTKVRHQFDHIYCRLTVLYLGTYKHN